MSQNHNNSNMSKKYVKRDDMTPEQKRELTERIARWLGIEGEISPLYHNDIPIWECTLGGYYTADSFCFLGIRDDWALVEEEIENRGLYNKWLNALVELLMKANDIAWQYFYCEYAPAHLSCNHDEVKLIRRASPLVCAMAWDQMIKEIKK